MQKTATVVYRVLKDINRLRENKYGLQTKIEGNKSILREINKTTDTLKCTKNKRQCNPH